MANDTHEEMTRAARVRAAVIAHLNAHPVSEFTNQELFTALNALMAEIDYNPNALSVLLNGMHRNGLVDVVKTGNINYYSKPNIKPLGRVVDGGTAALKPTKRVPDIGVEIVKSTGRVRLTVQGLMIEIGVVEK